MNTKRTYALKRFTASAAFLVLVLSVSGCSGDSGDPDVIDEQPVSSHSTAAPETEQKTSLVEPTDFEHAASKEALETEIVQEKTGPLGTAIAPTNEVNPTDSAEGPENESVSDQTPLLDTSDSEADEARDVHQKDPEITTTLIILCAILASVLAASVGANVMLYRRGVDVRSGVMEFQALVPTRALSLISEMGSILERAVKALTLFGEEVTSRFSQSAKSSQDLMDSFSTLQEALNQKDREIERWKTGYDNEVFRKFIGRFAQLAREFTKDIEDLGEDENTAIRALEQNRELLIDALEECGVKEFQPNLGDDYVSAFGIDDNPRLEPTVNPQENRTIAAVLYPGFQLETPDGPEAILKAQVSVYVLREEENDG